jgi:hypothetical protein
MAAEHASILFEDTGLRQWPSERAIAPVVNASQKGLWRLVKSFLIIGHIVRGHGLLPHDTSIIWEISDRRRAMGPL